MKAIEDEQVLARELQRDELLRRDVMRVLAALAPYVPLPHRFNLGRRDRRHARHEQKGVAKKQKIARAFFRETREQEMLTEHFDTLRQNYPCLMLDWLFTHEATFEDEASKRVEPHSNEARWGSRWCAWYERLYAECR